MAKSHRSPDLRDTLACSSAHPARPSLIPVLAAAPHTSSESVPPVPKDSGGPDGHPACLSHLAQQVFTGLWL